MSRVVQTAVVRTNTIKNSVCKIDVQPVTFTSLWNNYVDGNPYDDPAGTHENQCAIRLSATLHRVGIDMKSFSQKVVPPAPGKESLGRILLNGKPAATRADEMAAWLRLQPFCGLPKAPENVTGSDWASKAKGRTGIIYFGKYWRQDGDSPSNLSGGHIDLWNGEKMTGFGTGLRVRWNIVIPGIWSDLRKAQTILLFPIQ